MTIRFLRMIGMLAVATLALSACSIRMPWQKSFETAIPTALHQPQQRLRSERFAVMGPDNPDVYADVDYIDLGSLGDELGFEKFDSKYSTAEAFSAEWDDAVDYLNE